MRAQKGQLSKLKGVWLSSGAALSIPPGASASSSLNLSRGGEFTGAFFGNGTINLTIGGQSVSVSGNGTEPAYFGPLVLKGGIVPVRAAAIRRSVWRQRKAGICNTSTASATCAHCSASCTSVSTGRPVVSLISAKIGRASARPSPRALLALVRFALSKEDL